MRPDAPCGSGACVATPGPPDRCFERFQRFLTTRSCCLESGLLLPSPDREGDGIGGAAGLWLQWRRPMRKVALGLTACVPALIVALCIYALIGLPALTLSSVAGNRAEHREILAAARFADEHHRSASTWPDGDVLAEHANLPNVHLTPGSWLSFEDACPSFTGAESDRFILSTWRGEYFDCLAYPSGRHTFGLSVWDYVLGSSGVTAAILLSVILVCVWAIRRLLRGTLKPRVAA